MVITKLPAGWPRKGVIYHSRVIAEPVRFRQLSYLSLHQPSLLVKGVVDFAFTVTGVEW